MCHMNIKIPMSHVLFCVDTVMKTDQEEDISGWAISKRMF